MTENSPQNLILAIRTEIQFYLKCHFFNCLAALNALQMKSDTIILIKVLAV